MATGVSSCLQYADRRDTGVAPLWCILGVESHRNPRLDRVAGQATRYETVRQCGGRDVLYASPVAFQTLRHFVMTKLTRSRSFRNATSKGG